MDEMELFQGRRFLNGVVVSMYGGKATLTCTPWEEWRTLVPTPFTLRCGNSREHSITRRIGIEQSEQESFDVTLGSTLGVKGIASVESAIKGKTGYEIKFSLGSEQTEKFAFDSPPCGRKTVRLYQRVRCIHLKYEDRRFWHKNAVDQTLTQWLPSIYDATVAEQYSPECNCNPNQEVKRPEGIAARVDAGLFAKLAGFFQETGELLFGDDTANIADRFNWGSSEVRGTLSATLLPDYLRFLIGVDGPTQLQAAVWQESVFHPTNPETVASSYVTVELDENMELIEEPLVYQMATAPAAITAEPAAVAIRDEGEEV